MGTEEVGVGDISSIDAAYWAVVNRVKLQHGVWSFEDRPYLAEPMQCRLLGGPRRRCFMKATQGGVTEQQVCETLWGLIYGYYPRGVLYLFPTTEDVREFSKARFGPLISSNPTTIGRYVRDTDTASLKRVGDAVLFLRGGTLSTRLEVDAKESGKLRGISVDKVVYDELDLMDPDVMVKAQGRMGASEVREEVYISNPTLPASGIAAVFDQSDQRHWFRRCVHCGLEPPGGADWSWFMDGGNGWVCAEVQFPDNVKVGPDGVGYIACRKCGKPVDFRLGIWVPKFRDRSDYMWGYRWSQLSSPVNDPWEILTQYANPPDGNLADIVRLRLGLPFVSAEDKLEKGQVYSCCTSQIQMAGHKGPCAMGVDVRRHKNVVIGYRASRERFQVVRVARVQTWDEILDMIGQFNIRSCVVDIRPYEDAARTFQKKSLSVGCQTWLCEYSETTPVARHYATKTGIVKVNRTEIMDLTHRWIASGHILSLPKRSAEIEQFALECCSTAKVEERNRRTNQLVFRYRKLGTDPDDYRHALNYFALAADGGRIAVAGQGQRRRTGRAKTEYAIY